MNKDWMIFYREHDGEMYIFNGVWPTTITPDGNPWAAPFITGTSESEMIQFTEEHVGLLRDILNSKDRVFKLENIRYRIHTRGEFPTI